MNGVRPDWPQLRGALEGSRNAWQDAPARILSELDQVRASARDRLDEFGITAREEDVAYAGICFAGLIVALADWCFEQGVITEKSCDESGDVAALLVLLLADYAPAEARTS